MFILKRFEAQSWNHKKKKKAKREELRSVCHKRSVENQAKGIGRQSSNTNDQERMDVDENRRRTQWGGQDKKRYGFPVRA